MKKTYILEVALIELILFLVLWLLNPYIAFYLTLVVSGIACGILFISIIAEIIERSKVPRAYFWWMGVSIIVPLLVMALFTWTGGGGVVDWMK